MQGRVHSIESMGLVDGPGIRTVVFLQGCSLRCAFCHNPDTWSTTEGNEMTPEELVKQIVKFKSYHKASGGGVTFSGGEPLLQPEFLIETMKLCKEQGIHIALDTAGCGLGKYEEILKYVDLIIYDIKHIKPQGYLRLTKHTIDESLRFLDIAEMLNKKMWIRQVIVPGINDNEDYIRDLGDLIKELKGVEKVELLPYHKMGLVKYEIMKQKYPLEGVPEMDKLRAKELQELLRDLIKK